MEVRVLGALTLDDCLIPLTPRDRAVMGALTVRPGASLSLDSLAAALWGDERPASWSHVIPGCIMRLRRLIAPARIETTPLGYRLATEHIEVDADQFERFVARGTGVIGPTVSGVFLLVIAAINIASLRRRHGHAGGPVLRLLGLFEKAVDRPSRMYLVGLLFGLGFDTATEIGLLTLAGAATLGAVPWWAALTLPILFAAGMSAFDTTQGAVMRRAYTWQPGRRHLGEVYVLAMTGLSVVAALLIAIVQLSDVLVANLGLGGPLPWLASVGIDDLGFVLTGLLLVTWAAVLVATRRRAPV